MVRIFALFSCFLPPSLGGGSDEVFFGDTSTIGGVDISSFVITVLSLQYYCTFAETFINDAII